MIVSAPGRDEAADFYWTYISKVSGDDVMAVLQSQLAATMPMLRGVTEQQSSHRYAPEKWSIREVLNHMSDTERLFSFRAFWIARGMTDDQPSFDENVAASPTYARGTWRTMSGFYGIGIDSSRTRWDGSIFL